MITIDKFKKDTEQIFRQEIRADDADDKFYQLCHSIFYLPELIKKERTYRKITQEQLSKETGISRSTISLLERGENITIDVVKSCLLALKHFDLTTNVHKKRVRTKKNQ
jgi:DNA-binding XRE family transcriptional regulator